MSPTNTFNLVIAPNVLVPSNIYTFKLTATYFNNVGYVEIRFRVYPPPSGGLLFVDPLEGDFLSTQFTLQAVSWM